MARRRSVLAGVDACLHDGIGVLELVDIHDGAAQEQVGVAGILDAHLAHHLADDDLDVLVVDINALLAVDAPELPAIR